MQQSKQFPNTSSFFHPLKLGYMYNLYETASCTVDTVDTVDMVDSNPAGESVTGCTEIHRAGDHQRGHLDQKSRTSPRTGRGRLSRSHRVIRVAREAQASDTPGLWRPVHMGLYPAR